MSFLRYNDYHYSLTKEGGCGGGGGGVSVSLYIYQNDKFPKSIRIS